MLSSSRDVFFACPPSPLWNPPSFTVESTLSFSRFRYDPPSLAMVRRIMFILTLSLYHFTIWKDGSVPFPFGKAALAYSPTAHFVALKLPFPFWKAQFVQVFPLKPAPFCKLSAASTSLPSLSLCPLLLP